MIVKLRLEVSYRKTVALGIMSPKTIPVTSMHALEETVEGAGIGAL